METGQAVFHSIEHIAEHKWEPIDREEDAKARDNSDFMQMFRKERFSPVDRDIGVFEEVVDHQRVQEPNGKFRTKVDRDKDNIETGEVFYLREWLPAELRTFGLLQCGLRQAGKGNDREVLSDPQICQPPCSGLSQ